MSRQKSLRPRFPALVVVLLLVSFFLGLILALTAVNVPAYVTAADDDIISDWPTMAGGAQASRQTTVVVRAYFDDPALVTWLAGWKEPWEVHYDEGYLIVEATPDEIERLQSAGFRLVEDPVLTAEFNQPRTRLPGQAGGIPGYPCYRTVEETLATAERVAANYSDLATWIDIGDSWEKSERPGDGYDIHVLQLTQSAVPGPKPQIFIMSAIHAREYATAELNTRFAEFLVDNYGHDPNVTYLLDYHIIHLLLLANPDGRIFAEAGQFWRKNVNENYCAVAPSFRGADLNRNFDFSWNCCGGSSGSQCSELYRGPSAASEPETLAIQDYLLAQFPDQRDEPLGAAAPVTATGVFLDIHSYGQLILWPWGFTDTPAGNAAELKTLGSRLAYFNNYEPQQAIDQYPADGTTTDYAYGQLGLAVYTFELGTSFFQDCASFESTIWPDNLPALLYAAKVTGRPYQMPAGPEALDVNIWTPTVNRGQAVTLTALLDDSRFSGVIVTSPVENIIAAEYTIDTPPGLTDDPPEARPLVPVDGAFDTPLEQVQAVIDSGDLAFGKHIIFVHGRDWDGNWGPIGAAFLNVTPGQERLYLPLLMSIN